MNSYGVPSISVQEVAARRANGEEIILLDVREPQELAYANLGEAVLLAPLSELARAQLDALPAEVTADENSEIIVFCHHGVRSAQVVAWLQQNGWTNARNMDGGIEAYAAEVDAAVGRY
jgi:rhodanese-related sulfurtransferase